MCGILRHLRESGVSFNFCDEKDVRFHQLQRTLDARIKQLTKEGKGCQKKQAEPITPAKEHLLWTTGQLGDSTSQSMINTVFFYNTKLFGLRAMDEHRRLACEQFEVGEDNHGKYIKFDGRSTKTLTGGLHQRNLSAKSIRHYSMVSDSSRCLHNIYSSYLEAIGNTGVFYQRPLPGKRFSKQPMGVNKLSIIKSMMCQNANIPGYFTNHSGKRTCATALFRGFDEQLICSRTGYRSTAVRAYKQQSSTQKKHISSLLDPPSAALSESLEIDEKTETPEEKQQAQVFANNYSDSKHTFFSQM